MPQRKRPKKITLWCTHDERATIMRQCGETGAGNATDAILAALSLANDLGLSIPDPARPDAWTIKGDESNGNQASG